MATLTIVANRSERGQAIIELALTLPLLLLIVLGIFDFGLMLQRYEVVTNAAREGARVGVLPGYSTAQAAQHTRNYLATGGLATGNGTCTGTLANGNRCVTVVLGTTTIPASGGSPAITVNQVTVTAGYAHEHMFVGPIMGLFGSSLGTTQLRAVSTMRIE